MDDYVGQLPGESLTLEENRTWVDAVLAGLPAVSAAASDQWLAELAASMATAVPALSWYPDALADGERLYLFLAQASPQSAARAVTTIRKAAQLMARNPELGTPLAEFR